MDRATRRSSQWLGAGGGATKTGGRPAQKSQGARSLTSAMLKKLAAPYVAEADRTPAVVEVFAWSDGLVEIIHRLLEEIGHLKDEVAVLQGEKKRPTFKQSRMNEDAGKSAKPDQTQNEETAKRPGSAKKHKTAQLKIDRDTVIEPVEPIPPGSRFKGYRDFVVQELAIESRNTRYRLARWQTPEDQTL